MCGWFTLQVGEVVGVYNQRAQFFPALPELSSAELPVRDNSTVSDPEISVIQVNIMLTL